MIDPCVGGFEREGGMRELGRREGETWPAVILGDVFARLLGDAKNWTSGFVCFAFVFAIHFWGGKVLSRIDH